MPTKRAVNKNFVKVTLSVDFIKSAHDAACAKWKLKLEDLFPEILKKSRKEKIQELVESMNPGLDGIPAKVLVSQDGGYVFVPLPHANKDWTLSSYKFVQKFCEKYPETYLVHGPDYVNSTTLGILKKAQEDACIGKSFSDLEYIFIDVTRIDL